MLDNSPPVIRKKKMVQIIFYLMLRVGISRNIRDRITT